MSNLELEEKVYEHVYQELNNELADRIIDKLEEHMAYQTPITNQTSYIDILASQVAEILFTTYKSKLVKTIRWDDI